MARTLCLRSVFRTGGWETLRNAHSHTLADKIAFVKVKGMCECRTEHTNRNVSRVATCLCFFNCTLRTPAVARMFTVTELDNICQYIRLGRTEVRVFSYTLTIMT